MLYPDAPRSSARSASTTHFGDEVIGHLEFIRFNGKISSGLPLVRFTTEERLDEIMRDHEDDGRDRSSTRTATRWKRAA